MPCFRTCMYLLLITGFCYGIFSAPNGHVQHKSVFKTEQVAVVPTNITVNTTVLTKAPLPSLLPNPSKFASKVKRSVAAKPRAPAAVEAVKTVNITLPSVNTNVTA